MEISKLMLMLKWITSVLYAPTLSHSVSLHVSLHSEFFMFMMVVFSGKGIPYNLVSMVTFIVVIFDGITGFTAHCTLVLLVAHPGLIPDQFSAGPVSTVVEFSAVVSINTGFCE